MDLYKGGNIYIVSGVYKGELGIYAISFATSFASIECFEESFSVFRNIHI